MEMGKSGKPSAARSRSDGYKGTDGWMDGPPVSPASAHVTPCGRPMRPPYMPISWTDGQQSPRSKGPTRHASVPYWRRLRCRSGSIKSHFAGSHDSPLTAADDVPFPLVAQFGSFSLPLCACACPSSLSRLCSSILCAMHSVHCTQCLCVAQ